MASTATRTHRQQHLPAFATSDARWEAVRHRDRAADGVFYYSVLTTGVYCRPSCAARRPRRTNVAFHASCEEAEAAGFHPCKRCRPDEASLAERHASIVAQACRLIEQAEEAPSLDALARTRGKIYGPDGAAGLLGLKPTTLAYRMKALGIPHPPR